MSIFAAWLRRKEEAQPQPKSEPPAPTARPRTDVNLSELCDKLLRRFNKTLAYLGK
jgi:hypothetical protein